MATKQFQIVRMPCERRKCRANVAINLYFRNYVAICLQLGLRHMPNVVRPYANMSYVGPTQ